MTTKYPSNRTGPARVETRGGSRSPRNTRQFIPGKPGPAIKMPPKRPGADYGYIRPDELDWDEVDRRNRERAKENIRRHWPDLAKRMKLMRNLRSPLARRLQWLDVAKDLGQALDLLDEWSDSWWQVGGVTTTVPAAWTGYWELCYTNPNCSTDSTQEWAATANCSNVSACFYQNHNTHAMSVDVPAATTHVIVGKARVQFGVEQLQHDLIYQRIETGDAPAPDPLNPTQDLTVQKPYPAFVFPPKGGEVPIAGAMEFAVPSPAFGDPYTQPSEPHGEPPPPWRSPDAPTRPVVVPVFPAPLVVFPWPRTQVDPTPQPETQVIVIPGTDTEVSMPPDAVTETGQALPPEVPPPFSYRIPPRPRNRAPEGRRKERKVRMALAGRVAWGIVNFITESMDFVDAIHAALPYKLQAKPTKGHRPTPSEKAERLWKHWDEVDVAKGVENFVNNQIEDWLWGRLDQSKNLNQLTGAPTGGAAAIDGQWRPGLYDLGDPVDLAPEVHFDPDTGEWELDTPFGSMRGNLGDRFGR